MEAVDKWYCREVLQWRTGASVAWAVISLPVTCVLYLVLSSVYIFSPLQWLTGFFSSVISFSFVSMAVMVMIINCGFYLYSSKTFTVIPSISVTRLVHLPQLFSPSCLMYAGVCTTVGFILAWVCTRTLGGRYTDLSYKCTQESDLNCINEFHLFLVLYGGYTGVMYIVYHYVKQHNVLQFPAIQQAKFFQVRTKVFRAAWSSLGHVIWQIKFYYVIYYLFGHIPRDWIADSLSLKFSTSYKLDSLYGLLLDLSLAWQTLLVGLFIQFTWSFGALLYKIYNTERYEFPISSMFDNYKNKCLIDALSCNNTPVVQALGFFDLDMLSKHSYTRRKEVFSLSQPGGHPHNWNKIEAVCVSSIHELSSKIEETNFKILASASVRQPSTDKPVPSTTQTTTSVVDGNVNGVTDKGAPGDMNKTKVSLKDKVLGSLKKRPYLTFFTSEMPETRSRNLFASSFIQIWAVEALSTLVSASFQEDSYGVVQMALPDIITAMVNLQENVDKHFKLTGGVSRRTQKDQSANDLPLKYLLQMTLKSSIYRIVNTFGKHLLEIELPFETEKKLRNFIEYKE